MRAGLRSCDGYPWDMTSPPNAPHPSWTSFPRRGCLNLVLGAGLLVFVWFGAIWTGLGRAGLGAVRYTKDGGSVGQVPTWAPVLFSVLTAVGLALLATFPVGETIRRIRAFQLFGASWTGGWLAVLSWLRSRAEFVGPDERVCVRANCWPLGYQEVAVGAPLAAAVVLLAVMAFFPKQSWQVRALIPACVYLALVLFQRAVWDSHVLPLLSASPPS